MRDKGFFFFLKKKILFAQIVKFWIRMLIEQQLNEYSNNSPMKS